MAGLSTEGLSMMVPSVWKSSVAGRRWGICSGSRARGVLAAVAEDGVLCCRCCCLLQLRPWLMVKFCRSILIGGDVDDEGDKDGGAKGVREGGAIAEEVRERGPRKRFAEEVHERVDR